MLRFNNNAPEEENEPNDYFSGPDVPDKPRKQKKPALHPDDPEYWKRDEDRWEHLRPRRHRNHRMKLWAVISCIAVIAAGATAFWLRYCHPYVEEAEQYGYVDDVQYRGTVFHTYEGVLLPYRALMDTARVYSHDFIFSCTDIPTGRRLMGYSRTGRPVRVVYKKYHATLPWRGESKIVITKVDSVQAELLLPPERRPDTRLNSPVPVKQTNQ